MNTLTLIPWALDQVWRHYATHVSGLAATGLPLRGTSRNIALQLEQAVIDEVGNT